ncbi:hypothetical protein HDU87_007980 [Geranomyces variabilis]|uniref:Uncharacterized protein n=1 Tax=Geranomyces variabilis TaxID=109894 RepID=A0AAD5TPR1_9FUNG|nr:hypothetical protein HDU87_007980 [Geranomyces variabilis]
MDASSHSRNRASYPYSYQQPHPPAAGMNYGQHAGQRHNSIPQRSYDQYSSRYAPAESTTLDRSSSIHPSRAQQISRAPVPNHASSAYHGNSQQNPAQQRYSSNRADIDDEAYYSDSRSNHVERNRSEHPSEHSSHSSPVQDFRGTGRDRASQGAGGVKHRTPHSAKDEVQGARSESAPSSSLLGSPVRIVSSTKLDDGPDRKRAQGVATSPISRTSDAHRIPQAAESEQCVAERHDGPSRAHPLTTGATPADIKAAVVRASADALNKIARPDARESAGAPVVSAAGPSSTAGPSAASGPISVTVSAAYDVETKIKPPVNNTLLCAANDGKDAAEQKIKAYFPSDDENTSELSEVPPSELESSASEHSSSDDRSDSDSADGLSDSSDDGEDASPDFPSSRRTSVSGEEIEDFTAPLLDPNDMRSDDAEYTENESKARRNARRQPRRNLRSTRSSARGPAARNLRKRSSPEAMSSSESDHSDAPVARARSLTLRRSIDGSKKTSSGARRRAVLSSSSEGEAAAASEVCTNPNRLTSSDKKSSTSHTSKETSIRYPKQPRARTGSKSAGTARSRSSSPEHSRDRSSSKRKGGQAAGDGCGAGDHGTDTSTTKPAHRSSNGGQTAEDGFFLGARFHRWERLGDRDKSGRTMLRRCVESHNVELLRKLLAKRADPNVQCHAGFTPLHTAALSGTAEEATLLLRHGASVDIPGMNGDTPLFDAVTEGNDEVVELLLLHGANVAVVNENGQTPLTAGDQRMATLITDWLDKADAVTSLNSDGYTPLHVACMSGKVEDFLHCVKYGADVNCRGHNQQTPLHLAALNGHHSFVVDLLDCGAEVDAINAGSNTPLDFAVLSGQRAIVEVLLEYGADPSRVRFDSILPPPRDVVELLALPRSHWVPHKRALKKIAPVDRAAQRVPPACSTQGSSSELPDAPTAAVAKRRDSRHSKHFWHSKNELFANGGIMPEEVSRRELRKIERYNQVHKESPVVLPPSLGKGLAGSPARGSPGSSTNTAPRSSHKKKTTRTAFETASPDNVETKVEDVVKPKGKVGRPPKDPSKRAEEQQLRSVRTLSGNVPMDIDSKPVKTDDAAAAAPVKKRSHKKKPVDESQQDGLKATGTLDTPHADDSATPTRRSHKKRVPASSPPGERRENKVQKLDPDTLTATTGKKVGRPPSSKSGKDKKSTRPVTCVTSTSKRFASPQHDSDFDEDLAIMHSASLRKRSLTKAEAELDSPTKMKISPGVSSQTGRKPSPLDLSGTSIKRAVPESPTDRVANAQGQLRGKSPPQKKAKRAKPVATVSSTPTVAPTTSPDHARSTSPASRKGRPRSAGLSISATAGRPKTVTPDPDPVSYSPGSPGGVWGLPTADVPAPPSFTLPPAVVSDPTPVVVTPEPGNPDNAIRRATETEVERRLRVCVPLYSFALPTDTTNATPPPPPHALLNTNPNGSAERWMLDWQLGLYFGYRSSKAFLDANPSVRARVASEEEKRLMERCAPLAAQVLESQLHNDPEVRRYLRTVDLPALGDAVRSGLRFTYYDCKFVRLAEVRGLLTRLEHGGLVDVVLQ